MNPLQCPTCDLRWNIPDNAGRIITCPRCLAALNNPYSPGPQESRPVGTKPPPLPVIPLERQVDRDQRSGQIGLIVIAIVIIVGVILFITALASGANTGISGIIGLIVVTSVALIPMILIYRKKQTPASAIPMTQFPPPLLPGGVLNYSAPMRDPRKLRPAAFFAQTIGGIILGIAGGAALFAALMGMGANENAGLVIFAPAAAGVVFCLKPRIRGLGVGLILALPVVFVLLLGFCAILIGSSKFH